MGYTHRLNISPFQILIPSLFVCKQYFANSAPLQTTILDLVTIYFLMIFRTLFLREDLVNQVKYPLSHRDKIFVEKENRQNYPCPLGTVYYYG